MAKSENELQLMSAFQDLEALLLEFNNKWQKRKRKLDTKFIVNFVVQLVAGSAGESYRMFIQNIVNESPVFKKSIFSQLKSVAASSICEARQKVDENVFILMNKVITKKILSFCDHERKILPFRRVFAVDGTKLNIPPELGKQEFHSMTAKGHHPQALVSCIYSLDSSCPIDFILESSGNERACVAGHLSNLLPYDVVIYDRGYFGFELAKMHIEKKIDFIFRLPRGGFKEISAFMEDSNKPEQVIIDIVPTKNSQTVMRSTKQVQDFSPLKMRIVRAAINGQEYFFATSLISETITPRQICEAYGFRWKIEELYKVPKAFLEIEKFHSKTKRGICQEVYASFFIVSLTRLFDFANKKKAKSTFVKTIELD